MKELLDDIISSLKNNGFDFNMESKLSSYNPLECFVEQVSKKEIRHSQILEDLLDENGHHGYKNLFIESFLSLIKCHVPDGCDIYVERERKVSRVLTEGCDRSIDLVLIWKFTKKKYAIIIENKLNGARFQPYQLDDYKMSLENEGFTVQAIVVIYDKKLSYGNGIISLCSSDLSDWLNKVLDSCDTMDSAYCGIKAYAQLIDNMAIKNINMINAESIVDMARESPESFQNLSKIVEAYKELKGAVFNELINDKRLKVVLSRTTSSQLQFWLQEDYDRNRMYIVVEFSDNEYQLYLKNDNFAKDRSRTLSSIGFEKYNDSKEWYVSKKSSERTYAFPHDTDRLISNIKKLIVQLKSING